MLLWDIIFSTNQLLVGCKRKRLLESPIMGKRLSEASLLDFQILFGLDVLSVICLFW